MTTSLLMLCVSYWEGAHPLALSQEVMAGAEAELGAGRDRSG